MSSAGVDLTRTFASSPPTFLNACTLPAGTTTTSPGPATILLAPRRNLIVPLVHDEALLLLGMHVSTRDVAVGRQREVELEQLAVRVGGGAAGTRSARR